MRTLTQITANLGHPSFDELEQLEREDKHPRVLLFERLLNAKMMDEKHIAQASGLRKFMYRLLPINIAQALDTYRLRHHYDAVISWAENLGIPFAALLAFSGGWTTHVGIFSWISRPKKAFFFRYLHPYFDRIILMSSRQHAFAVNDLKIPAAKVRLLRWPVDQKFWRPIPCDAPEPMICSVGREMRDYGTLIEALRPMKLRCHIAAGGITSGKRDPWRKALSDPALMPAGVTVGRKNFAELRQLYADSLFVVVPLFPTDTDNGTTTVLEAMAMGKAVICSKVEGQQDVIEDGVNGIFVPPQDPAALRHAIEYLLQNPDVAERMGRAGRQRIEQFHSFDSFVGSVANIVREAIEERISSSSHFSRPRDQQHPIRTLTIVTPGSNRPVRPLLRQLEQSGAYPRVRLYEQTLNSAIMDEHYIRRVPHLRRLVYHLLPVAVWQSIEALILRGRFDAIITWSTRNAIMLAMAMKFLRKRARHVALLSWFSKPMVARFMRFALPWIDHIVVWSSTQHEFALQQLGIPASKITQVSRRVDHQFWHPMDRATDTICSVGQEMRDYPTLIAALDGTGIPCHIATGALRGELYDTVRALNRLGPLPANITAGKLNFTELRDLYARSRFVVIPLLPSDTDNGVTVIEEAMAMGKAVICSRTRGQVDMLQDGVTGIFVPQGDPVALRAAIMRLWEDPDEAERMGRAAREFIVQHHTLDRFVDSVNRVVRTVIQETPIHEVR